MENKKIKKMKKPKKDTKSKVNKNKNKNKNIQSIKINISSSGGLGGSGGGGMPSNIPIPIQSFSRAANVGENVDVSNLLRRIENQSAAAFSNFNQQQQRAFDNFNNIVNNPIAQQINRDDEIDAAEFVNNGIDENFEYKDTFKNKSIVPIQINPFNPLAIKRVSKKDNSNDSLVERIQTSLKPEELPENLPEEQKIIVPIVTQKKDKSNESLLQRINPISFEDEIKQNKIFLNQKKKQELEGGGGEPAPLILAPSPAPSLEPKEPYISTVERKNGSKGYVVTISGLSLGTYPSDKIAMSERDLFFNRMKEENTTHNKNIVAEYKKIRKIELEKAN